MFLTIRRPLEWVCTYYQPLPVDYLVLTIRVYLVNEVSMELMEDLVPLVTLGSPEKQEEEERLD